MTKEKRRAVRSYLQTLGPALRRKHGDLPTYTPALVKAAILDTGLSIDYACWAYLLYSSPADFRTLHESAGEACDYDAMREVVGETYFHGNLSFSALEVATALDTGVAEALATGAVEATGCLCDVDWSSLLDLT